MKPILHKDARITVEKLVDGDKHYYFGYYGKSPWSHDGRYVVALEVDFIDRFKDESESANIILIDVKTKKKKVLAKTRAWNWQQGAMMQWMPSKHKENRLIYNDIKDGVFISRIIDVDSGKEDIIPYPIYDVHPKGRYATSLSFEKLEHVRRGYGYPGGEKDRFDKPIAEKEGVYLIDLEKKRRALIISLEELYNHKKLSTMDSGYHWIDQPAFNTDGTRICFLHRWKIDGGLFHSRFFTINPNGKDLFMFPDSGYYSHFIWKNSSEILMFCSISESFGNVRKGSKSSKLFLKRIMPLYRKFVPRTLRKKVIPTRYFLLQDKKQDHTKIDIYFEDGHPSFSHDGRYIITDTYPNAQQYRKLMVYDCNTHKRTILGEFYSLPDKRFLLENKHEPHYSEWGGGPFRVDLHPRWSFSDYTVCFDSIHEGKRGVYTIDLHKVLDTD